MNDITLANGVKMPQLGLGVYNAEEGSETENAVLWALQSGYRLIDTAELYGNEESVGNAVTKSGIPREQVFLTAKVWNTTIRAGLTLEAFYESLRKLNTDYIDLYLLHWPTDGKEAAWHTLEGLYKDGKIRAIGVSNYKAHHLEEMKNYAEIMPMYNQVESHPAFNNQEIIDYCQDNGIAAGAWSPLGGSKIRLMDNPVLTGLAKKYGKTPAQIVLRWDIQRGISATPKSVHKERIISNSEIFNFHLSAEDMKRIWSLDTGVRIGADPDNIDF